MATAETPAAVSASALMDPESSPHRLGGDIGLELLVDVVIRGDGAAAMGTSLGKRSFQDFVEHRGGWGWTMGVRSVRVTGLAAGFFAAWFGWAFRKRGSLPFAGAFLFLEPAFKLGDSFHELADALFESGDYAIALDTSRAWPNALLHADNLEKRLTCSCAETSLDYGFFRCDR
jgi:hypothetical protein